MKHTVKLGPDYFAFYINILRDSLVINASYLFSAEALNSFVGFVFWAIAARLYTEEVVGFTSALIATAALVSSIANLGLGSGIIRFLPESNVPVKIINSAISFTTLVTLLVGFLYLIGIPLWSPNLSMLRNIWFLPILFLAYSVISTILALVRTIFVATKQAVYSLYSSIIFNIVRFILVYLLIELGLLGLMGSFFLAIGISLAISIIVFIPRFQVNYRLDPKINWYTISAIIPFSLSNYISSLLIQVPQNIIFLLILERLGATENAYAYIAWMIGTFITAPGTALASSAFAEGSHQTEKIETIFTKSVLLSSAVTVLICIALFLAAPLVLSFFGSSYESKSLVLLRWLVLAAPLVVITSQYFAYLRVRKRVWGLTFLSGAIALITLGMSYSLLSRLGIQANGIAWFCANGFVAAFAGYEAVKIASRLNSAKKGYFQ